MSNDTIAEVAKVSPPIAITGMEWFGFTLSNFVLTLTAIYTTLLIYTWIRRHIFNRRLSDKDPFCANDCPVAMRIIQESNKKADKP